MNTAAARAFTQAVARRHFSVSAVARQARTQKHAPAQWGKLVTQRLGTMAFFVPAAAGLLTWPLWLKAAFDGHI